MRQKKRVPSSWTVEVPDTLLPFLLGHIKSMSRNNIKGLLTRRQVLVDGRPQSQFDRPLQPGTRVELAIQDVSGARRLSFPLLYEDADLIVIDKPAGLLTIATDREKTATAYRELTSYVRSADPDSRIFVLHRLDRDTSGVVMFAKTEAVKRAFQDNWDKSVLKREYEAVVEGAPEQRTGTVRSWLRETSTHLVYSSSYQGGGKEAVTHYQVLSQAEGYARVRCELETGRKNQIRVHMQDLGHPVAGDKKYGAMTNPLKRLCLHATSLEVIHPLTNVRLSFTSPTPKSFKRLCGV